MTYEEQFAAAAAEIDAAVVAGEITFITGFCKKNKLAAEAFDAEFGLTGVYA